MEVGAEARSRPWILQHGSGGVHRIFVDETMVNVGGIPALIWVAFEPDLRAILDFHVSWRGNSIYAYTFIRRPVHKYGGVPIYTDGAGWYADACRWAGVERIVYGHPLKNLMEHGPVRRGRDGGVRRPLPGRRAQAEIGTRLRARAQLAISVHVHAGLRVRERGPGMDGGPRF